ncbi:MAG: hypothetical protein J1F35_08375 [Erysipelotrichales bacterium]|nr:hypothetical protein [Erysipelotrichales bacterium]
MDRKSQIIYTKKFIKDYPYSHDGFDHFMYNWMYPFLNNVYNSRKEAYDAIDKFIKEVKNEFKKYDYGNYIIPNISEKWFEIRDYKEIHDDFYFYCK